MVFSQLATHQWEPDEHCSNVFVSKKKSVLDAGQNYDCFHARISTGEIWCSTTRAPLQNYEISINRATDRLNYYVSGGFYDQDGIAQGSTFAVILYVPTPK